MDELAGFEGALGVTLDRPLASIGARGIAHLLDQAIVVVLGVGLFALSWWAGAFGQGWTAAVAGLLQFLLQWFWFAAWEGLWHGQTPGKRLLGLRVVQSDGRPLGALGALVRNLLRIADFLPGAYGVGMGMLLLHPQSRRIGDLAAGTVVVVDQGAQAPARRLPEGLSAADVALIEQWFEREGALLTERRTQLAAALLAGLQQRYPQLDWSTGDDPAQLLARAFPVEAPSG